MHGLTWVSNFLTLILFCLLHLHSCPFWYLPFKKSMNLENKIPKKNITTWIVTTQCHLPQIKHTLNSSFNYQVLMVSHKMRIITIYGLFKSIFKRIFKSKLNSKSSTNYYFMTYSIDLRKYFFLDLQQPPKFKQFKPLQFIFIFIF